MSRSSHPAHLAVMICLLLSGGGRAFFPADPKATAADIPKLIALLGDDEFSVREEATQKLIALGKPALSALQDAARSTDPEVRKRADIIRKAIQASPRYLLDSLRDPDVKVRRKAVEAIDPAKVDVKALLPVLAEALKDKDDVVRDGAIDLLVRIDPAAPALVQFLPKKAHVNGKYLTLQRRIRVENDRANYTDFHEWGMWNGTSWAGFNDLPTGYWVYVYPHWYIWKDMKGGN